MADQKSNRKMEECGIIMGRCGFFMEHGGFADDRKRLWERPLHAAINPVYWPDNVRWAGRGRALAAVNKGNHSEQCFDQMRNLL